MSPPSKADCHTVKLRNASTSFQGIQSLHIVPVACHHTAKDKSSEKNLVTTSRVQRAEAEEGAEVEAAEVEVEAVVERPCMLNCYMSRSRFR